MMAFGSWLVKRWTCFVVGHRMASGRVFYPPAKAVVPGFRCERCGKTQQMLYRWQTPVSEANDD